jgi:cytochrome c peroxidase
MMEMATLCRRFLMPAGVILLLAVLAACGADTAQAPREQVVLGPLATLPDLPPIPEHNPMTPEKVELGKMLFFEPRLSLSGIISCHTCHNLSLGGTDRIPVSIGHDFQTGDRNAPTVLNAAFFNRQFWDGRADSLEQQAEGPIEAGVEMAMPRDLAVDVIRGIPGYLPYFQAAFPGEAEPINFENIVKAIATFERTLITPNDLLDRYLRGEQDALSPLAIEGIEVFRQKGCTICHRGPLLSTGEMMKFEHGQDLGLFNVTGDPDDKRVFRVPTLRNLPLTAPYFHDGSAATIEEAIHIMASVQLSRTISPEEEQALVAFLGSLIGEQPQVVIPVLPP